jgi:hypothetical protein
LAKRLARFLQSAKVCSALAEAGAIDSDQPAAADTIAWPGLLEVSGQVVSELTSIFLD